MPLDLHDWVSPPQTFEGLHRAADNLQRNKQYAERKAERERQLEEKGEARRNSLTGLLQEYTNPKDYLTGTVQDPRMTEGVAKILQTGVDLINQNKGLDAGMLMGVLAPMVNKLSLESQNLKTIKAQRDETTTNLKGIKGIDINKYNEAFDKAAFYTTDENGNKVLKDDLSQIDPTKNYGDEALNDDVYTNEGLNDFVKSAGRTTLNQSVKTRDANGRLHQMTVDITKPSFMVQDTDQNGVFKEFVPDFDIATEGEAALIHEFKDEKGNAVKAPVRVVKDYVLESLPKSSKGFILQEVRKILKKHPEIPIGSPQAENLAKAIAYDELKNNAKDWSSMKRTDVDLRPLPPKTSINIYGAYGGINGRGGGNAFDSIADEDYGNFKVQDGRIYKKDGSLYNTLPQKPMFISGNKLPTAVRSTLKAGGIDPDYLSIGVDAEIKDGKIISISNKFIGTVSREDMEGVYQPKFDTEPQKGRPLQFAKPKGAPASKTAGKYDNVK